MQEQRLQRLKDRLDVPFDETRPDHQVYAFFFLLYGDIFQFYSVAAFISHTMQSDSVCARLHACMCHSKSPQKKM